MTNAMILAAGEGVRFRPYTSICPKPSIPFLNIPLIGFAQYHLKQVAIDNLAINTFHLPEHIINSTDSLPMVSKSRFYSHEKNEILGSGGGLKKAQPLLASRDEIILINGDELLIPKDPSFLSKALEFHRSSGNLSTLIVIEHPEVGTKFGGVWCDSNRRVLGFGKNPIQGHHKGWHFIGLQILSKKIFDYLPANGPSDILYTGLTQAIKEGHHRVQVFPIDCIWFETGNLKDYLDATENCLQILTSKTRSIESNYFHEIFKFYNLSEYKTHLTDKGILFSSLNPCPKLISQIEGFLVLGTDIKNFDSPISLNRVVIENESAASQIPLLVQEGLSRIERELLLDNS